MASPQEEAEDSIQLYDPGQAGINPFFLSTWTSLPFRLLSARSRVVMPSPAVRR